jgi:hypothetical protein
MEQMFQRTMHNKKTCITDTNTGEGKKVWKIVLRPKLNALRRIHTYHAVPMPFHCRSPAVPLSFPCHAVLLRV